MKRDWFVIKISDFQSPIWMEIGAFLKPPWEEFYSYLKGKYVLRKRSMIIDRNFAEGVEEGIVIDLDQICSWKWKNLGAFFAVLFVDIFHQVCNDKSSCHKTRQDRKIERQSPVGSVASWPRAPTANCFVNNRTQLGFVQLLALVLGDSSVGETIVTQQSSSV